MRQILCVNLVQLEGQWDCWSSGDKPRKCKVRAATRTCCACAYLRQAAKHHCRPCPSALAAVRAGYRVVGQKQPPQIEAAVGA